MSKSRTELKCFLVLAIAFGAWISDYWASRGFAVPDKSYPCCDKDANKGICELCQFYVTEPDRYVFIPQPNPVYPCTVKTLIPATSQCTESLQVCYSANNVVVYDSMYCDNGVDVINVQLPRFFCNAPTDGTNSCR